jgi:uncharacterized OB-fold protein
VNAPGPDDFNALVQPPVADLDSREFWANCRQHRLVVRVCSACGRGHHPPGPICPWCTSREVTTQASAGRGTVITYVEFRHPFVPDLAGELPYTVVKVAVEQWPDAVVHGRYLGPGPVRTGDRVQVAWASLPDGTVLPNWAPESDGGQPADG